jgi:hypothetical protein
MDNRKFEKLIDLIINENEEQARELFHEIVVEKSRQIYESLMDEEDESMSMLDEIGADLDVEQSGGTFEDDEDMDMPLSDEDDGFADDEEIDLDADELDDMSDDEELEDRVVDLEEKLDQLMAEFEELMDQDDDMGDEDMDDEDMDMGDEDMEDEDMEDEDMDMDMDDEDMDMEDEDMEDDEDSLDESVQLQTVKKVSHGDNGAYTTSPTLTKPRVVATGAKPTAMGQAGESVPTSAKAANNYATKGQGQLKGAGQFKNAPGHKGQDLSAAPKAKTSQESGVNTKSPVAESRRRALKQQFGAKRK